MSRFNPFQVVEKRDMVFVYRMMVHASMISSCAGCGHGCMGSWGIAENDED